APGEIALSLGAHREAVDRSRDVDVRAVERDVNAGVWFFFAAKVIHLSRRKKLKIRIEIAGIDEGLKRPKRITAGTQRLSKRLGAMAHGEGHGHVNHPGNRSDHRHG